MLAALVIAYLAAGCVFVEDAPKQFQYPPVVHTERVAFPAGGSLRVKNSVGELTVEGCDCQEAEIVTTKFGKPAEELDKIHVTSKVQGNELLVTTDFPHHLRRFPNPAGNGPQFRLRYHIRVPRSARLDIDHELGEVNIEDVRGNIRATALQGAIVLHLPESGQYAIDAQSKWGAVNSDFPGHEKRRWWLVGHRFVPESANGPQKLYLRAGWGDIVILKIRIPQVAGE
jgi:hypothetical protein